MYYISFHNFQNKNLQTLLEDSLQFSNKSMLESAQQIKKIDLDYHAINNQWFRVAHVILCNFRNTNLQILPKKTPPGNPSLIINKKSKKKKKEKEKKLIWKHFCKHFLGVLVGYP